jgi:hypothetical protein
MRSAHAILSGTIRREILPGLILHLAGRAPAVRTPAAPGRRHAAVLGPARPAAWRSWGRVGGAVSRAQQRRPACAGTDRKGRVGGAVSGVGRWRPTGFGSGMCFTKSPQVRPSDGSSGAWRLCRCTLAAGAHFFVQLPAVPVHLGCKHGACGASLSHPPAQRPGAALGGGWAGNTSPNAAVTAGVLLQPEAQRQ